MASVRRRVKRTVSAVKKPAAVPLSASRLPKKGLAVSSALFVLVVVALAWKFASANSAPTAPAASSSAPVSLASLTGQAADTSLLTPPLPLITPANAPVPDAVKQNLPAAVPAQIGEEGASYKRVVDKKIENGFVTLVLKDEKTGQLSVMKQPLGTMVGTVQKDGKEQVAVSAPIVTPPDPVKDDLPTLGIEKVRAGMTVPTRNPITGKTEFKKVTRTFKRMAYELRKLELADAKTGKVVDTIKGTPEHPFFTPDGMVAMGDLKPEMKVITRRGPPLVVKTITVEKHPEGIPVFNFEVEGDHTYFVGKAEGGTWVHNTCPPWITPGSLPAAEERAVLDSLSHLGAGTRPAGIQPRGWGRPFRNNAGDLPGTPGAGGYREYDVLPPPGTPNRGPRRIVVSDADGSIYYTWTHYGDAGLPPFVRVR